MNSVTLLEWEAVSPADIGANFFLSLEHIGKNVCITMYNNNYNSKYNYTFIKTIKLGFK